MGNSLSTFFLFNLTIDERQRVDRKIVQSRDHVLLYFVYNNYNNKDGSRRGI